MSSINDLDKLPKDVALNIIVKQLPSIPPTSQLVAFFALLLISIPLLIALAMTIIFGKRIRRHPVSYIFFLSMALSSFFYSFLIFAGEPKNILPPEKVRIASAVFAITSPTVEGGTVLALVIKIWTVLVELVEPPLIVPIARILAWDPFLLSFPWLISIPVLIYAAVIAARDPLYVQRVHFYCTVLQDHNDIHSTAMLISMIELALTIIFSLWAFFLYFSVSRTITNRRRSDVNSDLIFRVMAFTCWIIMTLIISAIEYSTKTIHIPLAIIITTNPVACFLIFASQRDMLKVWGLSRFAKYFNCSTTSMSTSDERRGSRNESSQRRGEIDDDGKKQFSKLPSVDDGDDAFEYDEQIRKHSSDQHVQLYHNQGHLSPPLSPKSPSQNWQNNNRNSKLPSRKPVPSYASYELPALPSPSLTSPTVSLSRNSSHNQHNQNNLNNR